MNNLWNQYLKAVLWKEAVEALRKTPLFVFAALVVTVGLQYIPVTQIVNNAAISDIQKMKLLTALTIYFPIMIIPLVGSTILSRTITEEKTQKSIHVLLASGVPSTAIWMGKLILAVVVSYLTSIAAIGVYGLCLKYYVGYALVFDARLNVLSFITMPLAAIGILAVIGISYWVVRNSQALMMFVPLISLLGTWNFVINFGLGYPEVIVAVVSFAVGFLFILLSVLIIGMLPKEVISEK